MVVLSDEMAVSSHPSPLQSSDIYRGVRKIVINQVVYKTWRYTTYVRVPVLTAWYLEYLYIVKGSYND